MLTFILAVPLGLFILYGFGMLIAKIDPEYED